ncbi:CAAX prenyl protease 1 [Phlyctochytrium bullatum]|nr:CAAX prenyl protease 1 [Phlyctochytrium bullatum]
MGALLAAFESLEDQGINYKHLVLGFSLAIYLWEQYLNYRQLRILRDPKTSVPALLKEHYPIEEHKKSKAYSKDKAQFGFVQALVGIVQTFLILSYDVLPFFWNYSKDVLVWLGMHGDREILQSIVFVTIYMTVSTLLGIPLSLYSTFVIEERHGFNKQTLSLFFTDMVKELALGFVFATPLVSGFIQIVRWSGDSFFFYVWLFVFAFQIIMILLFPTVIQPLFNKFTPLEEGELKTKIEKLASRIKFPLTKIFVIDGSKRSSHSNAYFTGLFKDKRIVLFDTLLEQTNHEEVLGVLAHELGHWQLSHMLKRLVFVQVQMFGIFYLFSFFIKSTAFYQAFGFDSKPIIIGMMLFSYIFQPVEAIFSFLGNVLSRLHEFEADGFAKKLGYAEVMMSGLIKIHLKNLGNVNPDTLYSAWHYSHPPLVERLSALSKGGKSD